MLTRLLVFAFFIFTSQVISAQNDFQAKYDLGKEYYKKGKYAPAMELFKPLTVDQDDNKFLQHAHYYYSLSALKAGSLNDAYTMIRQLIYNYPDWNNIEEAYYLAANISFEQKKTRQALKFLEGRKKELRDDIDQMKLFYLNKLTVDTLVNLQKDYNSDAVIANVLYKKLTYLPNPNEKQRMLIEYLAQEFKIATKVAVADKKSVMKTSYNVAVLFPFMLKDFNLNATNRPNQYLYDMYSGMKLSVDSLKKAGVTINLIAFDTEKSDAKITEILTNPELKSVDMIIGPVTPTNYALVNEFGMKNNILVVNPFSGNTNLIEGNPFVYLLQPSLYNWAKEAANFADSSFVKDAKVRNVIIFQSPTVRDSVLSQAYKDSILAKGFNIRYHEVVQKDNMKRVQEIFRDSIMLTTVSHIFVSTSDQVLAANIVSAVEISGHKIPMFSGGEWLQFPLLTYDQYERRGVHFLYTDFIDYNKPQIYEFRKAYFSKFNTLPLTSHAYQGYDMMRLYGGAMGKYGNFPINGIKSQGFIPGYVLAGFNYSNSQSNGFVPIVKFTDSALHLVNNPVVK